MTLNIEVKGNPASLRATATWLGSANGTLNSAGNQVYGARTDSTAGWNGSAGDGFRATMTHIGGKVDQLEGTFSGTAAALNAHASTLDTVRSRMSMARQVAVAGGLTVTATLIMPPGAAPAAPTALATDATPAEKAAHASATAAQIAYARKVRAYQEVGPIVTAARNLLTTAQNALVGTLSNPVKLALVALDGATGLAAHSLAWDSKYRARERGFAELATRAARVTRSGNLRHDLWLAALAKHTSFTLSAEKARILAEANLLHRYVNRLPPWVKKLATTSVAGAPKPPPPPGIRPPAVHPVVKGVVAVGRRIPLLGVVATAIGVGIDIHSGKDPTQAVVSGVAGLAGGVLGGIVGGALGFAIAGPVGAGVGAVVVGALVSSVASQAVDDNWK